VTRDDGPDLDRLDLARDRRPEHEELAGLEISELAPSVLAEPELVRRALDVDVEPGPPDELVVALRRCIFVELRESLRREHGAESALAAARREVDHGAGALGLALLRAEDVRLVDDDERAMPELLRRVDERLDEFLHEPDALMRLELVDVEDRGDPELEEPFGQEARGPGIRGGVAAVPRRQDVVEFLPEARELSLRVDDQVLDLAVRLLEQPAEQPGLAGAAVRLDEEPRVDQRVEVAGELVG
jgi:hypothetical protein